MTNEQYHTLIHPYTDAMNLILTRLEILNHCAADNEDVRPIHGITHRIKETKDGKMIFYILPPRKKKARR